jgi:protein phosphatase
VSSVELHHGGATDIGRVREVNEDSLLIEPPVFVVADGMGGHAGGDVASRIVIEEFARLAVDGYDVEDAAPAVAGAIARSQQRIAEHDATRPWVAGRLPGSGTTVVAALLVTVEDSPFWLLANVGDSRAYRLADDGLVQVTVDHSLVQEMVDSGRITAAQAELHPDRHVLTRALGGGAPVDADYFRLPAAERLLLCSDGVTGMLTDGRIEALLREYDDPRDAADRLVVAAVEAGGADNATAIVVDAMASGAVNG